MMWPLIRSLVFAFEPELAHSSSMAMFSSAMKIGPLRRRVVRSCRVEDERLRVRCFGLDFPNPVGLAAGFDKDARWINGLDALGFGFIEVGTLTSQAQPGNPRPRVFRLTADNALVNRIGFDNRGAAVAAARLRAGRSGRSWGSTSAGPRSFRMRERSVTTSRASTCCTRSPPTSR